MDKIDRRSFLKRGSATMAGAALASGPMATAAANPAAPGSASAAELVPATAPAGRDFPHIGGNLGNQNYSSLSGINRGNIRNLGGAWLNRIEGGIDSGTHQSSAVAVDGVLYIESHRAVHAVDGVTGETIWTYVPQGSPNRRGVAVGDGKVFTIRSGNWLVALDQQTGEVVWERQHNGYGNIAKVAVIYHDGRLYVGTNDGGRGAALCFDASDGDYIWHFWGTPGPGQFGNDSRPDPTPMSVPHAASTPCCG